MHIPDLLVAPNRIVHALLPHRLERIVRIRQRDPAPVEEVAEQRLIGEVVAARGGGGEGGGNEVVRLDGGVDDLQAAVGHREAGCGGGAVGLRCVGGGVLGCECAVCWDPAGKGRGVVSRLRDV